MNIKEPLTQEQMTQQNLQKRRFFIKGIGGALTPVVLTIASPPIFGQAMCLSQQMSGNLSAQVTSCVQGVSPLDLKAPKLIHVWKAAGWHYGDLTSSDSKKEKKLTFSVSRWNDYTGGTRHNDVEAFGTGRHISFQGPSIPSYGKTPPMREWLNTQNGGDLWHLIAALLNSKTVTNYPLSPGQVKGLYSGDIPIPPPYTKLSDYLETTWV